MSFDTPWQTIISFAALIVWTWVVQSHDPGPVRRAYLVVWVVSMLIAASSLSYIDAVPADTSRFLNLAARVILLVSGILVVGRTVAIERERRRGG